MADDTKEICEPLEFHPCDTPRGMEFYNLKELTDDQQHQLNEHKLHIIRENQKYLQKHPEIKEVISIVLQQLLKARPKVKTQHFIANYFRDNWQEIEDRIEQCITKKAKESMVGIKKTVSEFRVSSGSTFAVQTLLNVPDETETIGTCSDVVCKEVVDEMLYQVDRDIDDLEQVTNLLTEDARADSDPMLLLPFVTYSNESINSHELVMTNNTSEEHLSM